MYEMEAERDVTSHLPCLKKEVLTIFFSSVFNTFLMLYAQTPYPLHIVL